MEHVTAKYNKHRRYLFPFFDIDKCSPLILPDCIIIGSIPRKALIDSGFLNLEMSPSSAISLEARLSPILGMERIGTKYSVSLANSIILVSSLFWLSIRTSNNPIVFKNWETLLELISHPEIVFDAYIFICVAFSTE